MTDETATNRSPKFGAPFVGREPELNLLLSMLQRAIDGHGGLVLVSGEAGIGKTALIQQVAGRAREIGALVLTGAAYDLSATPPYGPWLELTRTYRANGELPALPGFISDHAAFASLLTQDALLQSFLAFFLSVAEHRPLVLVLEDLHWSDRASLDLLRVISRSIQHTRIRIIATYRDDEVTRRHHLFQLLPSVVRESQAERISLGSLDRTDIRILVNLQSQIEENDRDTIVDHLMRRAEGNPLFTVELLRMMQHPSAPRRAGSDRHPQEHVMAGVPALIRQMVERRAASLSDEARAALQIASVIGPVVPLDIWTSLAGAESVGTAADEALEEQILTEDADHLEVTFRHALIREAIYESLSLTRRRQTHRQVAEALLATPRHDPDTIAFHLQRAGDPRAAEWLIAAGQQAEERFATVEGIERYEAAIDVLRREPGNERRIAGILLKIGWMIHQIEPLQSDEHFKTARQTAQTAGDPAAAGYALLSIGINRINRGEPRLGLQDMRDGVREMESAPQDMHPAIVWGMPGPSGDHDLVLRARSVLSYMLAIYGRLDEAIETAERAIGLDWRDRELRNAQGHDAFSHRDSLNSYHGLGLALSNLGHPDDGWRAFRLLEDTVRLHNIVHPFLHLMLTNSYLLRQHFPYRADDVPERDRLLATIEQWVAPSRTVMSTASSTAVFELCLLYSGRWAELRMLADQGAESPVFGNWSVSTCARARLALYQGELDEADLLLARLFPDGPDTLPDDQPHPVPGLAPRIAAERALASGDLSRASAWLDLHDQWLDWSGAVLGRAEGLVLRGYLRLAENDIDSADRLARQALERATDPRQPMTLITAHRLIGELAAARGDLAKASQHLDVSLELAVSCAIPYERALALIERSKVLDDLEDREGARVAFNDARHILAELGARPALALAESMLPRFGDDRTDRPYGITRREHDVLALLAEGMSDKDIAERLFISPHTVMRHAESIRRKLDVDSRTAAAAKALRERLV
jgi:DNA-binding CsgD family transcriptional regulator